MTWITTILIVSPEWRLEIIDWMLESWCLVMCDILIDELVARLLRDNGPYIKSLTASFLNSRTSSQNNFKYLDIDKMCTLWQGKYVFSAHHTTPTHFYHPLVAVNSSGAILSTSSQQRKHTPVRVKFDNNWIHIISSWRPNTFQCCLKQDRLWFTCCWEWAELWNHSYSLLVFP